MVVLADGHGISYCDFGCSCNNECTSIFASLAYEWLVIAVEAGDSTLLEGLVSACSSGAFLLCVLDELLSFSTIISITCSNLHFHYTKPKQHTFHVLHQQKFQLLRSFAGTAYCGALSSDITLRLEPGVMGHNYEL